MSETLREKLAGIKLRSDCSKIQTCPLMAYCGDSICTEAITRIEQAITQHYLDQAKGLELTDDEMSIHCLQCPSKGYESSCLNWVECNRKAQLAKVAPIYEARIEAARKEERDRLDEVVRFARDISKVMNDLKSSSVWFILQSAYEDFEWDESQALLNRIIDQTKDWNALKAGK